MREIGPARVQSETGHVELRPDQSLPGDAAATRAQAVLRVVFGSRATIAGTVYGTIVVLAVLAAGGQAFEHDLWRLVAIVVTTVLVLWMAHVYAHGLGESLQAGRRLTAAELGEIARRELAIPLAAVAPTAVLVLGALGLFGDRTAGWLAFGLGVATLAVQGLRYALVERLGRTGTLAAVALNVVLGLVLVILEVLVSH
jgi:hypothetical protein